MNTVDASAASVPREWSESKRPCYLAVDQGSHASRAILFDGAGCALASAYTAIETRRPGDGWVEHDPDELVASVESAIGKVGEQLDSAHYRVVAAGLATQRSSICCWDRDSGRPLSPVLSWQDRRAACWLTDFESQQSHIHQTTGLFLSAHYGASKLRWCLDHLPDVAAAADRGTLRFGPLSSFLLDRLVKSGADLPAAVDPANASRTLLWDIRTQDWSDELLTVFGIPRSALPVCRPSRGDWGSLTVAGRSIPVTVVTGDQSAALFAFGQPGTETVFVNLGTGAFLQRPAGAQPVLTERLLASVVFADATSTQYVLEGTVNGAGSAVNLLGRELGFSESQCRDAAAHWLQTCPGPPLFVNAVAGLGSPWWRAELRSRFIGAGTPDEKMAAVLESIVFMIVANVSQIRAATPALPALQRLVTTGGLAAIDPLCQRLADLTALTVWRPSAREATGRGLAYLLRDREDGWPSESGGMEFAPVDNPSLAARFRRWQAAMEAALAE